MLGRKQNLLLLYYISAVLLFSEARPLPDSAGHAPLPGPGLAYGGIPYGSMSGNVAEYFKGRPSSDNRGALHSAEFDFAPIEQYL